MSEETTPIKAEDLTKFLGVEAEDFDAFKETFNKSFIRRDNVKQDVDLIKEITGSRLGHLESDVRSAFKGAGVSLDNLDTQGKKVEELFQIGLGALKESHAAKVSELEEVGFKDKDEAFKDLEGKFDRLNKKYIEEKELREQTATEFVVFKEKAATDLKSNTISTLKQQAFQRATFKKDVDPLAMKGFESELNSKYKLDIDDNGALLVTDKEGARIANPNVSGTFMDYDTVIRQEQIANNLYPLNEASGNKQVTHTLKDVETPADSQSGREVNRTYRG